MEMRSAVRPPENIVPFTAFKIGTCEIIYRRSRQGVCDLQDFSPKLSATKIKAGVSVGLKREKVIDCKDFPKKVTSTEKAACNSIRSGSGLLAESHSQKCGAC